MEKDKKLPFKKPNLPDIEEGPPTPPKPNLEEGVLLPSKEMETPFGRVETPPLELPPLEPPPKPGDLSDRQEKALDHAVGSTGGTIIGFIPVVGDFVSDVIDDMHGPELKKVLTARERKKFTEYDRTYPTLIALIRVFQETE